MDKIVESFTLSYEYQPEGDKALALDAVDIHAFKGEFLAVLGHNGSGKSTFAKLVNALLTPSGGRVVIKGLDSSLPVNTWDIRRSVGMVFQNPDNQIIATIVEEDVAFGPENLGIAPDEIRKRVDSALAAVDMAAFMGSQPHNLSGGQKQRIAIAGILAMRPDIIVLDEPTAMLDPIGRREVLKTVKELNAEGITIILITHYMDEAAMADRIIVMDSGKVKMEGAPKAVFSRIDELKAIGLDVPQVTEIAHRLRAKGIALPEGILHIEEMVTAICQLKPL